MGATLVECTMCGRDYVADVGRDEYTSCRYCGARVHVGGGDFDFTGGSP